ncbi:MAG: UDP-3-O-(3-hydroxymyristoyl)glucosamine N-acyltransferase [Flavobacteriales bacterium]|nr:UDP-3-O-(3-hydroxymyristoyl)glucosamine N-acyltransferase [Flavobacteriales bacterium]
MEFTATQIAALIDGTIEGNADVRVHNLSKIEEGIEGTLTFLANPKYEEHIYKTGASIAIVSKDFEPSLPLPIGLTLVKVADAYGGFVKLLAAYDQIRQPKAGIDSQSYISPSATIGENVYIGPFVFIGDNAKIGSGCRLYASSYVGHGTKVGNDTVLFSGVRIYNDCTIGNQCTFHSGVIIGGDGFGFVPNSENNYNKVPQIGNVIIEDYVEIGANTTVDRATLGSTIIRKGVKLDNLIQIAHNVEIGENTVIAAQTGVAGSTKIGKDCMIGGQVGIVGHITIADKTKIAAQSGIGHSLAHPNTIVQGSPAFPIMDYKKAYVGFRKLPELMARLDSLEAEIRALKNL